MTPGLEGRCSIQPELRAHANALKSNQLRDSKSATVAGFEQVTDGSRQPLRPVHPRRILPPWVVAKNGRDLPPRIRELHEQPFLDWQRRRQLRTDEGPTRAVDRGHAPARDVTCGLQHLHPCDERLLLVADRAALPHRPDHPSTDSSTTARASDVFDTDVQAILAHRPKRFCHIRVWTLVALLLDTALRIDEALTLTTRRIDFDNRLFTVSGKGNRERKVPFAKWGVYRDALVRVAKGRHIVVTAVKEDGRIIGYGIARVDEDHSELEVIDVDVFSRRSAGLARDVVIEGQRFSVGVGHLLAAALVERLKRPVIADATNHGSCYVLRSLGFVNRCDEENRCLMELT